MAYKRVAAVTGANKGIGLAIVRNLALQYPSSASNNGPLLIYLTARDQGRGEAAVKALQNDTQLKKAKALADDGGLASIKYHSLDISKPKSITDFAAFLKQEHPEGIDIVVNNAGIAMDGFNNDVVHQTLQCNYYGTLTATRSFLPLIRPSGRLVNVASMVGHLNSKYSSSIRSAFASSKTVDDVTKLMESFTAAVKEGKEKQQGWPSAAYAVSKSGAIGMTRAIALQHAQEGGQVLVNSCCPGYVNTDMTRGGGNLTPDQGARTPVFLALRDIGGRYGEFWEHEEVSEW
ncbi:MAG: hypothetical protein LQ352_008066 [Teloschistes flavicans]|nr:MAG: hypothetical protein LQ352_008066 [Teloschistes flavicans]